MRKGLFTSMEEIRFQDVFVNGHIDLSLSNSSKNWHNIRQDNRRIAQNVKRLNQKTTQIHLRTR